MGSNRYDDEDYHMYQFKTRVDFEPMSLKRHRHCQNGGRTYDPSKKDKEEFLQLIDLPEEKMSGPIRCKLYFYCKRPKSHFKTGKKADELKNSAPNYNTNSKDLDNMVKFVLDALNDHLYADDSQIVEIQCKKLYTDSSTKGYIDMTFEELV